MLVGARMRQRLRFDVASIRSLRRETTVVSDTDRRRERRRQRDVVCGRSTLTASSDRERTALRQDAKPMPGQRCATEAPPTVPRDGITGAGSQRC